MKKYSKTESESLRTEIFPQCRQIPDNIQRLSPIWKIDKRRKIQLINEENRILNEKLFRRIKYINLL